MNNILYAAFGGFFGFILLNYIPSRRGVREELDLFIGSNCFHIHHWISCFIMLGLLWFGKSYGKTARFDIVFGILLGIGLEDFLFRNILNVRNCNR
jgi:hypothetical protein